MPTTAIAAPVIDDRGVFSFNSQYAKGIINKGLVEFNVTATEV